MEKVRKKFNMIHGLEVLHKLCLEKNQKIKRRESQYLDPLSETLSHLRLGKGSKIPPQQISGLVH